jgi:hypothetical protein
MSASRTRKRKDPPPSANQECYTVVQSITFWAGPKPIRSVKDSAELTRLTSSSRNWVTHEWYPQSEDNNGREDDEPRWVAADAGEGLLAVDKEDEWPLFAPPATASAENKDRQSHSRERRRSGIRTPSTTQSTRKPRSTPDSSRDRRKERRSGPKRDQSDNDTDGYSSTEGNERSLLPNGRKRRLRSNTGHDKKGKSRVGENYQVTIPPLNESQAQLEPFDGDVVWDPVQAQEAMKRGEDIDAFLKKGQELAVCTMLMEALHKSDYNTSTAMSEFIKLSKIDKRLDRVSVKMSQTERSELADMFRKETSSKKDFVAIAKATGYSMEKVLVQYYRWKGETRREEYKRCKLQRLKSVESDYCCKCDDGGRLIVCDLCRKSYHVRSVSFFGSHSVCSFRRLTRTLSPLV